MLFSGPSTGPSAARQFANEEGIDDALLVDMGGTSFDGVRLSRAVTMTQDGRINDFPTGISAVEILTMGAGRSVARVDSGGLLAVGGVCRSERDQPAINGVAHCQQLPTPTLLLDILFLITFCGRMELS